MSNTSKSRLTTTTIYTKLVNTNQEGANKCFTKTLQQNNKNIYMGF